MKVRLLMKDLDYQASMRQYLKDHEPSYVSVESDEDILVTDYDIQLEDNKSHYILSESQNCQPPYIFKYQHLSNILSEFQPIKKTNHILVHVNDFQHIQARILQLSNVFKRKGLSHLVVPMFEATYLKDKEIPPETIINKVFKLSNMTLHGTVQYVNCISSTDDLFNGLCGKYIQQFMNDIPFHLVVFVTVFPYPILQNLSVDKVFSVNNGSHKQCHSMYHSLLDNECISIKEEDLDEIVKFI